MFKRLQKAHKTTTYRFRTTAGGVITASFSNEAQARDWAKAGNLKFLDDAALEPCRCKRPRPVVGGELYDNEIRVSRCRCGRITTRTTPIRPYIESTINPHRRGKVQPESNPGGKS